MVRNGNRLQRVPRRRYHRVQSTEHPQATETTEATVRIEQAHSSFHLKFKSNQPSIYKGESFNTVANVVSNMGRNTRLGFEPTPAISRAFNEYDDGTTVLSTPSNDVQHHPGLGESGKRVQVVEYGCPAEHCNFDRMIRRVDVNPEHRDTVRYWCLNPNCVHFVNDHLSHSCRGSYPQRDTDEPAIAEL